MPVFLKSIEIENFKSYKGYVKIGPLKPFTAVVGPNGSGKSNFMDAISFVMGEKTSCLRASRLSDLIHGAAIGKPASNSASVTAVFELEDREEKRFTRRVLLSSSEHQINDNTVTMQTYLADLGKLGINAKAKNFLVFQGSVESIAMKNPKELTTLFEEISGSGALKAEYERLKAEMLSAEQEVQLSYQKKKEMAGEKQVAKFEKKETEKYQQLQQEYSKKSVVWQLFRLYHISKALEALIAGQLEKRRELEGLEEAKLVAERSLRERKKMAGRYLRDLASLDQRMREAEDEITTKRPAFIRTKENVAHLHGKVESIRKCLEEARSAAESQKNAIEELDEELRKVQAARAAYEATTTGQEQNQRRRDVQLEDQQIREYNRLKEEAGVASAISFQKLDSANRLLKSDRDRLENQARKVRDLEGRIKQVSHSRDETRKREEKLAESLALARAELEKYQQRRDDLRSGVSASEDRVETLQRELKNICEQLGDATLDTNELAKMKKKAQVVAALQVLFPDVVYDRMLNLCEPIHKRYNIAITKVLGKFMDAIVVDTERTARQCIQYLKEQCLEPETFLPLDYIQGKPVKERLRMIEEPRNVKLLFDVLKFWPKEIERAILFVTRNALVSETPEDASRVAYDMEPSTRYDCVALDGTFYQRSGIISGGSLDLAKRARRWDEKQIAQLELQKKKLTQELKDALLESRKNGELRDIESKINGFENRLKYIDVDLKQAKNNIVQHEAELKNLQSELDKLKPTIAEIEECMATKNLEIEKIHQEINGQVDELFRDFCVNIGVSNIREYEERELPEQQDRENKRMEFDNQCNRISNQLDFERQRDTQSNITRWENNLRKAEATLESARQVEALLKAEIDGDQAQVEELKTQRDAKREEANRKSEEVETLTHQVSKLAKDILDTQRELSGIETKVERRMAERHAIFVQCKVEGVSIPMRDGSIEDVANDSPDSQSECDSTQELYERENQMVIDFDLLDDEFKDIEGEDVLRTEENLRKAIGEIQSTLRKIQAPNLRADERLARTMEKARETDMEFSMTRKKATQLKNEFYRVQKERHNRFVEYLEHVSKEIDSTYRGLTTNQSAQAFLEPENPEEPYLAGVNYNCIVPGKRYQPMSNLSGGEKTVAALALLFAIQSMKPAPFFVLDEIDAALDNENLGRVARYIREKTSSLQTIIISLKEEFYSYADALIGIAPEIEKCMRSNVLTLDLTVFER